MPDTTATPEPEIIFPVSSIEYGIMLDEQGSVDVFEGLEAAEAASAEAASRGYEAPVVRITMEPVHG